MTELQSLFVRGMSPYFSATPAEIMREVASRVLQGGVLVNYEKGLPVAFCIIHWPTNALDVPQILHFFSEGGRETTRKLVSSVLDKVKQKGYNKLRAINGAGISDEVWKRVFHHDDWEIKPVKTVFEFEVKQ